MYVDSGGNGVVEVWNFGEIGNPETRNEDGQEKKQDVTEVAVGALHSRLLTERDYNEVVETIQRLRLTGLER